MNEHPDGTEVAAALEREVQDLHAAPFGLADVQTRARSIQRRRQGLVAAVVAAVVAVVVPSVLVWGGPGDRTRAPDPASPSPSERVAPGSSVLQGSTLTRPDGSTIELDLPGGQVLELAVLGDGRVVVVTGAASTVEVLGADGQQEASYPAAMNHVVVGGTSDTVAWIGADGAVRVLEAGVGEPTVLGTPPTSELTPTMVDAVLGEDCAGGGCRVLVGDGTTTTHEVTLDGARPVDLGEPVRVLDVSPDGGLLAYAEPPRQYEQYGCVGLRDTASGATTARSCDVWGLRFSPDGQHLSAAFAENNMLGDVRVLDLALEPVLAHDPGDGRVVSRLGWADPQTLLVAEAGLQDGRWWLREVPVDGTAPVTVVGPVDGENPERGVELLPSS